MREIILHTTHCPRCIVLKEKLNTAAIKYQENIDTNTMLRKGIEHVPMLEVDGELLNFTNAVKLINGGELR